MDRRARDAFSLAEHKKKTLTKSGFFLHFARFHHRRHGIAESNTYLAGRRDAVTLFFLCDEITHCMSLGLAYCLDKRLSASSFCVSTDSGNQNIHEL